MARIDEIGNTYGNFRVISLHGNKGSTWELECQHCKHKILRVGTELRRRKNPPCPNCCKLCGATRKSAKFRGNFCLSCSNKQILQWQQNNPQLHRDRLKTWRKRNPNASQRYRVNEINKAQTTPETFLKRIIKTKIRLNRALRKPYELDIDPEYIIELWHKQDGKCAISGLPMEHRHNTLLTVSVDRVDSTRGYVKGNVQLVCKWANYAKNNASNDEVLAIIDMLRGGT